MAFGPGPAGVSPDDIEALFRSGLLGPAQRFSGSATAPVGGLLGAALDAPENPMTAAARAATAEEPRAPVGLLGALPSRVADAPAPNASPASLSRAPRPAPAPAMPDEDEAPVGTVATPLPKPKPAPVMAPAVPQVAPASSPVSAPAVAAAPMQAGAPSAKPDAAPFGWGDVSSGLRNNSDMLMAMGAGLLSGRNWREGIAAGVTGAQKASVLAAAGDLARAKAERERAALSGNAAIYRKYFPNATNEEALAGSSNSTVMTELMKRGLPATETYKQETDADGNVWQTNSSNGQRSLLKAAEKDKDAWAQIDVPQADGTTQKQWVKKGEAAGVAIGAPTPGVRPITAEERSAFGLKADAPAKMTKDGPVAIGGGTSVTLNNAVNPILKGMGDQFVEGRAGAQSSADAVRAVQNARSQLDSDGGLITGFRAGDRLALQKLGTFLGVTDPNAIVNTETFRTQIKPLVLETVKGLGAGSGISNADRDFAAEAVGGNINLDEGTIRRVLDVTERAARYKLQRHNDLADQMLSTQPDLQAVGPMLRIPVPAESMATMDQGGFGPDRRQRQDRVAAQPRAEPAPAPLAPSAPAVAVPPLKPGAKPETRFLQLQQSGLSKDQAYQQMRDEGF